MNSNGSRDAWLKHRSRDNWFSGVSVQGHTDQKPARGTEGA